MKDNVYKKTEKGQSEVDNRSGALSMDQRRILILADGMRSAEVIGKLSLVENYEQALEQLIEQEYLQLATTDHETATAVAPTPAPATAADIEPATDVEEDIDESRELMLNSLQAFTSPVHRADLVKEINAAKTKDDLRALVDRWYKLISDNPYTMQQAEDLKVVLMEKLL